VEGDVFSIGTMYIQSNDLLYAFAPGGVPLYDDNGNPINAELTGDLRLYDAGTEGDQEPGVGLDQAPRQSDTDTGPSGEGSLVRVEDTDGDDFLENDGYEYLPTQSVIRITITPQESNGS
jgi:hypothetical protein